MVQSLLGQQPLFVWGFVSLRMSIWRDGQHSGGYLHMVRCIKSSSSRWELPEKGE